MTRLIDADNLIEHAQVNCEDKKFIDKLCDYVLDEEPVQVVTLEQYAKLSDEYLTLVNEIRKIVDSPAMVEERDTEQEHPTGDLISRQAVTEKLESLAKCMENEIEDAKKNPEDYTKNFIIGMEAQVAGVAHAAHEIIDMPSATGWISVSEGLPKEKQEVYVTVYFTEGDTGRAYGYIDGFGKWHLYSTVEGTLNSGYKVTAWMPLPEPYKGEIRNEHRR